MRRWSRGPLLLAGTGVLMVAATIIIHRFGKPSFPDDPLALVQFKGSGFYRRESYIGYRWLYRVEGYSSPYEPEEQYADPRAKTLPPFVKPTAIEQSVAGVRLIRNRLISEATHSSWTIAFYGSSIELPIFWPYGIGAALVLLPLMRGYILSQRFTGLCPTCGYDLRATPERCPECGFVARASGT